MDFRQEVISQTHNISFKNGFSNSKTIISQQKSYLFFKRVLDIIVSFFLILILLPVIVTIGLIIKITDPSEPVFFKQKRFGKNYKGFQIFKFRSMVHNAEGILQKNFTLYEEYLSNNFKLPENKDLRITSFGRFLRKTSLDELPQLFNVLKGEMSLVGPRPVVTEEIKLYQEFSNKFLSVKPGITGWWQISGRANVDYPERIYLDLYYIDNASLTFDLKIMISTLPSVFSGTGAH